MVKIIFVSGEKIVLCSVIHNFGFGTNVGKLCFIDYNNYVFYLTFVSLKYIITLCIPSASSRHLSSTTF